jgi:transcriptional regulator with XRE-family HTH domain
MVRRKRRGARYTWEEIVARIERRREARGVTIKHLLGVLDIDEGSYSRKVNLSRSHFHMHELSALAEELDAPIGWPFIDEDLAEHLERYLKRTDKDEPEE